MNSLCKTGIFAFALAMAGLSTPSAAAASAESGSTVNYGWEIVWNAEVARMAHPETGKEIELYRDKEGETEEDGFTRYEMLSVVGPVLSYSMNWYSQGSLGHPSYGTVYRTLDLSATDPAGGEDGRIRWQDANLSTLFGEDAVFKRLMQDPFVQLAVAGKLAEGTPPEPIPAPTNLEQLLERADGDCAAAMGDNLLTEFYFPYRLGGNIAVVQIGLSHGCEWQRGAFMELHRLYFPIPAELKASFDKAVKDGVLEDRPFRKPSFNCARAGTAIEFAICTAPALAELDAAMAKRYKAARQAASGDAKNRVKQDQRNWIETRDRECILPGDRIYYEVPGEFSDAVEACLVEAYEARLAALK